MSKLFLPLDSSRTDTTNEGFACIWLVILIFDVVVLLPEYNGCYCQ